jgi:DNA-directed RNA polymerase subunit M/transcription elongation factor TFIIS
MNVKTRAGVVKQYINGMTSVRNDITNPYLEFELPMYTSIKDSEKSIVIKLTDPNIRSLKYGIVCKSCNQDNWFETTQQKRSADEGETPMLGCATISCNFIMTKGNRKPANL